MSILRVANLQFNASGTKRIDYDATNDDGIIKISADAIKLPIGDTASRPNSQAGMIRYNSDTGYVEFGGATSWIPVASNAAFNVANAAFASANNVAPQVTPAFLTANLAYTTANAAYDLGTGLFSLISEQYSITSGVANTANAAFASANTKLSNATGTLAGSLTTTGSVTSNGYLFVTASDAGNEGGEIRLNGAGNYTGWALDVWQNNHRTFVTTGSTLANVNYFHAAGGSVRMGVNKADPLYTLDVNGELNTSSRGITKASMPSGSVLQVVNTLKSDTMSSGTSETWLDVTGMTATITPTSATSKIFVQVFVGRFYGTNSVVWRVLRNSGLYNAGDAAGSRLQIHAAESNQGRDANHTGQLIIGYIDSPATTSSLTYQLQFRQEGTNFTFNRNGNDADAARSYDSRSSSSMILMEIAQ